MSQSGRSRWSVQYSRVHECRICAPTGVVITASPRDSPSNTDIAKPRRGREGLERRRRLTGRSPTWSSQPGKHSLLRMPRSSGSLRNSSIGPPPASVAHQRRSFTVGLVRAHGVLFKFGRGSGTALWRMIMRSLRSWKRLRDDVQVAPAQHHDCFSVAKHRCDQPSKKRYSAAIIFNHSRGGAGRSAIRSLERELKG